MENRSDKYKDKIITIPNILSFLRLCLIPVIAILYLEENYIWSAVAVLISGLTDIVDGFIARTFHMVSDVGKVLDPVADKATQGIIMLLLATDFSLMLLPIVFLVIKETFMTVSGYMVIKKTGIVLGANWHGKLATMILTLTLAVHIFWHGVTPIISSLLIILSTLAILLSLVLYAIRNLRYLK